MCRSTSSPATRTVDRAPRAATPSLFIAYSVIAPESCQTLTCSCAANECISRHSRSNSDFGISFPGSICFTASVVWLIVSRRPSTDSGGVSNADAVMLDARLTAVSKSCAW